MSDLPARIDAAIQRAADRLLALQDAAGSWTDWNLPPGPSHEWTTAFVGWRLSGAAVPDRPRLDAALARACRWLHEHRHPDGGWGYNAVVPSDADSTALAILFLSAAGQPAPADALACLRKFQREDGGFSTYRPDGLTGSWGRSHPEITPVALRALLTVKADPHDAAIRRGLAAIDAARCGDGTWHAFWWTEGLIATAANLACLAAAGRAARLPDTLLALSPTDLLPAASLLGMMAAAGWSPQAETLAAGLLASQAADGTWRSAPALRITRRDCDQPWNSPDAGAVYADERRLFTTATVLAALAAARDACRDG